MKKQFIYGQNTVYEFIKSPQRLKTVFLMPDQKELINHCKKNNINFEIKAIEFFKKISSHSQNIAAEVHPYEYKSIDYLNKLGENSTILILDEIQDPHNFGAIIRSAAASNVDAIIIAKNRQVEVTCSVERTAVGTTTKIPIIKVANLTNTIIKLKKLNYWVYGAALGSRTIDYRKPNYQGKTAIVIGSEGFGIKPIVAKNCDELIFIPLANNVESLNASVASAVILYYVYNQKFPLIK